MSPLEQKPILHGRDHCPGGADPIPCMISGPSGDFEGVLLETGPFAYWRLGEVGEPWADTSGVAPASDLTELDSGTAPTPDVTGALPAGQDDGALEFNYDGSADSGGRYAASDAVDKSFDLGGDMSVCAWVKVKASALTRRGHIVGTCAASAVGNGYDIGWGLQVIYPTRSIRFTRGQQSDATSELYATTAGGVVAGDWNFFVGTYDSTTIRLYANGELVDSTADPNTAPTSVDDMIRLGWSLINDSVAPGQNVTNSWFYGTVDEAAVWTRALSQAEIDALYTAGVEGGTSGSLVLLGDGAGGTYWGQVPTAAIEDEAVTTLKIADETIVDADVATGADIDPLKLEHPGGTSTFLRADGTWATPTAVSDPTLDTLVWMPLADSDGILVLDADDAVIPTLIPI